MRIQKSCMFVLVFDIVWLLCDFPGRSDEPGSRQSLLKVQAHSYTRNQRVRRHRERDVRFSGLLRLQHRGPPLLKLPQVRFSSFFFHSHYSLYSFVIWNKYSSFEMRFITLLVFFLLFFSSEWSRMSVSVHVNALWRWMSVQAISLMQKTGKSSQICFYAPEEIYTLELFL